MAAILYFAASGTVFLGTLVGGAAWLRRRHGRLTSAAIYRSVMAGALAVGTTTHVENLLALGWLPAPDQPLPFNVYWSSLTVFDPTAAILLILVPRVGLVATLVIVVSDLVINVFAFGSDGLFIASNWPLAWQGAFGAFVAATFRECWRDTPR